MVLIALPIEHVNKIPLNIFEQVLPLGKVDEQVKTFIDKSKNPLCVACSGGPDSMALLMLVRYYWSSKDCILLHYNHRVRPESEEEEEGIKAFANALSLKIEVGHRLNTGFATEENLRKDRYAFFERMLQLHKSDILLLGHHQDDLFETVLMRLVRGVGLEGLIAPKAIHSMKTYSKVRPLLNFKKSDLVNACDELNIAYFQDHTNQLDVCVRNRVRRQILSKFDDVFTNNWRNGFSLSCSILEEHRRYLQKKLDETLKGIDLSQKKFSKTLFFDWDTLELRYFLQTWFAFHKVKVENKNLIDVIIKKVQGDAQISLNLNNYFTLKVDSSAVNLMNRKNIFKQNFHTKWGRGQLFLPNHRFLRFERCLCSWDLHLKILNGEFKHQNTVVLDSECVKFPLIVRNWIPGDRYCPIGKTSEKKLKDLFVDNKIQSKNDIPLICNSDGDIPWVPGLPPANRAKISSTTKMCIFLFYQNPEMV